MMEISVLHGRFRVSESFFPPGRTPSIEDNGSPWSGYAVNYGPLTHYYNSE